MEITATIDLVFVIFHLKKYFHNPLITSRQQLLKIVESNSHTTRKNLTVTIVHNC